MNSVDQWGTVYREIEMQRQRHIFTASVVNKVVPDATHAEWLNAIDATTSNGSIDVSSVVPLVAGVATTSGGLPFIANLIDNVMSFNIAFNAAMSQVKCRRALASSPARIAG